MELACVAPVADDPYFPYGETLVRYQVIAIGLGNRDKSAGGSSDQAIHKITRFEPAPSPMLPYVCGFDNHRHTAEPADGRCEFAGLKHVRMQNLDAARSK